MGNLYLFLLLMEGRGGRTGGKGKGGGVGEGRGKEGRRKGE